MSPAVRIGATGFALIAVCYGFARFALGLFLPQMDADLGLGPTLSGLISGGAFAIYCVAIIGSATLTERLGARAVATGAAVIAAVGMAGIALAPTPLLLAVAVIFAGASTGLASPPMASAVAAAVSRGQQDLVNTTINAGTSAGVALSGPIAFLMAGQWRTAFAFLAVLALIVAVTVARSLPASRGDTLPKGLPPFSSAIQRLIAASFLMGAASTAIWSFGGQIVSINLGWGADKIGLLWISMGIGGIAGAGAGSLVTRFGLNTIHYIFILLMAAGILGIAMAHDNPALVLVSGALFGGAYVMLTGVYLIWGVRALPARPATGLMVGFLTIAIGQTAGAPVFGMVMGQFGPSLAGAVFAALALVTAAFRASRMSKSTLEGKNRSASVG